MPVITADGQDAVLKVQFPHWEAETEHLALRDWGGNDPHYEVAPLIWNRWDEVVAGGDLRFAVRQRFYAAIDAAELDEDRARGWVIVRQMLNVLWTLEDAGSDESLPQDWLTRNIAIVKAIQD